MIRKITCEKSIESKGVEGFYMIDGELSIILGEIITGCPNGFICSKVDGNAMYLDEVKLNGFKILDANCNLVKEYKFDSFVHMEYRVKILNGKNYGALVISNYGSFADLKKIQYSRKTYDEVITHHEEFLGYDDGIKAAFAFVKDDEIKNTDSGYTIKNGHLYILLNPKGCKPCKLYDVDNITDSTVVLQEKTFNIGGGSSWGNNDFSQSFSFDKPLTLNALWLYDDFRFQGAEHTGLIIFNYQSFAALKRIKCTSTSIKSEPRERYYYDRFLNNLKKLFTVTNF